MVWDSRNRLSDPVRSFTLLLLALFVPSPIAGTRPTIVSSPREPRARLPVTGLRRGEPIVTPRTVRAYVSTKVLFQNRTFPFRVSDISYFQIGLSVRRSRTHGNGLSAGTRRHSSTALSAGPVGTIAVTLGVGSRRGTVALLVHGPGSPRSIPFQL